MRATTALFLLLLSTSLPLHAKQVLIATINHQTPRLMVSQSIMDNIYQRLGYNMTIVKFPPKRTLLEVNYGSANGELARGVIIEADNPDLIRIPYAIGHIKLVAIQRSGAKAINQLDDLKPLRIGVLRGFVTTDKLSKSLKREIYNDLPGLFKGLNKKRVDVILFTQLDSQYYFRQLQQKNKTQPALIFSQPLMEIPVYHYLHKRSKNIANALQQEMQKMQASGELQQLIDNAEQKFMAIKPNALKTH